MTTSNKQSSKDHLDNDKDTLEAKIRNFNLLKDYSTTPKNVVMVTIDDIIELYHELVPYTMSRLDDVEAHTQSKLKAFADDMEKFIVEQEGDMKYELLSIAELKQALKAIKEKYKL